MMDIKEILLTHEEVIDILSSVYGEDQFGIVSAVNKAQCLKLLNWDEQRCENPLHNLDGDYSYIRFECPECMAELRKELEG